MYAKLDGLKAKMDLGKFDEMTQDNCMNMATLLMDKYDKSELKAAQTVATWHASKFSKSLQDKAETLRKAGAHYDDLEQATLAGLTELATFMYQLPRADAIGRMLVRIEPIQEKLRKVRIRSHGKAARSVRGKPSAGRKRPENRFINLTAEDEIEQGAEWDKNSMEDLDYPAIQEDVRGAVTDVNDLETQIIITFLNDIPAAELAGGKRIANHTAGTVDYQDIVAGWATLKRDNFKPTVCAFHTDAIEQLLLDKRFLDERIMGKFMDPVNGMLGKSLLGMTYLCSNHIPKDRMFFIEEGWPAIMAVRRDRLMEPYTEVDGGKTTYGVSVSTRYGLHKAVPEAMAVTDINWN